MEMMEKNNQIFSLVHIIIFFGVKAENVQVILTLTPPI